MPKQDVIILLFKTLNNRLQKIDNIENKKMKLQERWKKKLDSYNKTHGTNLIFDNLVSDNTGTEITKK